MRASSIGLCLLSLHLSAISAAGQVLARDSGSASSEANPGSSSGGLESAFLDDRARQLLNGARERQLWVDRSVRAYEATASEKISVRMRALRRDRLIWGREVVARITWTREGPVTIDVVGAREVVPPLVTRPQLPAALESYVHHLVFDPADPYILRDWFDDGDEVLNPFKTGSELNYRYRTGGARTIRLPGGREVRLLELQLIPRRNVANLIRGSFWLEEGSHSVVQATFRPAAEADLLNAGALGNVQGKLDYITVEYGLWDLQWWLPRAVAVRGVATAPGVGSGSLLYERIYTDFEVEGEPVSLFTALPRDSAEAEPVCGTAMVLLRCGDTTGGKLPLARLLFFSDAGWVGSRESFTSEPQLLSAGAGVSLLDGLLRLDLARALKAPTGWRLTAYFDAWL